MELRVAAARVRSAARVRAWVPGLLFLFTTAAAAQTSIITGDPLDSFNRKEGGITADLVTVDGPGFTRAWRIRSSMSANAWDKRLRCFSVAPARSGDVAMATFWMRNVSSASGNGFTTFVVEHGASPWTKHAQWTVAAGAGWKKVQVPFKFPQDYLNPAAGGGSSYNLSFWVTFDTQEIEIGGIEVLNYGPGKTMADLGFTWEGREAGAAWRKTATERIERIRKGDIVVALRDPDGKPVPGAQVKVRMKKHAFGWGTAVAGGTLKDNARYREELLRNFNKVVTENDLKWPPWEAGWGKTAAQWALPWFRNNGIQMVRGHCVIWPGKENLPDDVVTMLNTSPVDKEKLRKRINDHIAEIMNFTYGAVTEWDVLNEPYTNKDVQAVLGDAEMAEWFKRARQADPNIKLYINDYSILSAGGYDLPHQNHYFNTIGSILNSGGPIDGIGFQGHFNMNLTPPARVLEILDRFAVYGKDLQVTEFDIDIDDEQVQADYTRDFLTAVYSHPRIAGFMMWGFWAGAHWLPRGAMFRQDWSTRPSYDVWRDLVYQQWWTNADGVTAADGSFRTRGFLGEYDVEVTVNGQTQTYPLNVTAGQPNVVKIGKQPAPAITLDGIVNVASYRKGAVAPGEMIEIWGADYGTDPITFSTYDSGWSGFAGNVRLLFDGQPAPLIHVLRTPVPGQEKDTGRVAAIVPYRVSGSTRIEVEYLGNRSNPLDVPVAQAAPGIFTVTMNGQGAIAGAAQQADGSWKRIVDGGKARRGGYISLYLTGEGLTTPAAADGVAPPAPQPAPVLPIVVRIGGIESNCQYNWKGLVYAGVTQVNACVPEGVTPGPAVPLELTVGGIAAQSGVTVPVE